MAAELAADDDRRDQMFWAEPGSARLGGSLVRCHAIAAHVVAERHAGGWTEVVGEKAPRGLREPERSGLVSLI
jgi:hypothetical protein